MRTLILALVSGLSLVEQPAVPHDLFKSVGLTSEEIAAVDNGRSVARVLPWGSGPEVYVFGAVRINGSFDSYLKAARDIPRLASMPGYLGAGELRPGADLDLPLFDRSDLDALKNCRPNDCDVQLPAETIDALRAQIDWTRPDVPGQVNAWARPRIAHLLRAYQEGGLDALGDYRDKKAPARVSDEFETMMRRADSLPNVLPELRRYLLEYPAATLPGADNYFYWETVDFGLKPTTRINHGVIYRGARDGRQFATVAIKQLYATHYFHTALDVSACIEDGRRGFYLLTIKGSQQDGLTGVKGSMLRKVAVDKTRKSLEGALSSIKSAVERASSTR